ncbi:MAG: hypothetical protein ACO1SV_09580 [Fimbriimonas sp.]
MNFLLPVLALALAVLSAFLSPRDPAPERPPGGRLAAAAALALVAIVAALRFANPGEGTGLAIGILSGLIVTAAAAWVGHLVPALALGVAGAAVLPAVGRTDPSVAQFALVASAGLASLALRGVPATTAATTAAAVAAASYLGDQRLQHAAAPTLAIVVALGAVVGGVMTAASKVSVARALLPAMWAMVAAGFLAIWVVKEPGVAISVAVGAIAGLAVRYLVPEDEEIDALRVGIAALIWLGVATLTFGLLRGFGMSLALLGGLAALLPSGGRRGLLTLGALAGLVMYRLLREAHADASRALDIGQHYALVGLALGFILPLLPTDWFAFARRGTADAAGTFLWGLLALAAPVLVLLVFGGVGAVGFIAGLGLSGLVQALRGRNDSLPIPLGMGMAGTTLLLTGWVDSVTGLTRDEKLRALAFAAVGIAVVAGLLVVLSRKGKDQVVA